MSSPKDPAPRSYAAASPNGESSRRRRSPVAAHSRAPVQDEIEAALTEGWGPAGADAAKALQAALRRARDRVTPPDSSTFVESRKQPRCLAYMPRARAACIRQKGHPGPHRSH